MRGAAPSVSSLTDGKSRLSLRSASMRLFGTTWACVSMIMTALPACWPRGCGALGSGAAAAKFDRSGEPLVALHDGQQDDRPRAHQAGRLDRERRCARRDIVRQI